MEMRFGCVSKSDYVVHPSTFVMHLVGCNCHLGKLSLKTMEDNIIYSPTHLESRPLPYLTINLKYLCKYVICCIQNLQANCY